MSWPVYIVYPSLIHWGVLLLHNDTLHQTQKKTNLAKVLTFFFLNTVEYFQDYSRMVLFRKTDVFCILWLKVWQLRLYYFWRRLLIPIHSTLRVWYDISNFPSILLPLLYFIKGQEISKSNGLIFISFKKLAKFFLDFDLSKQLRSKFRNNFVFFLWRYED